MSVQYELEDGPSDAISSIAFAPCGDNISVSSWDNHVYFYRRTDSLVPFQLSGYFKAGAAVLDVTCTDDTVWFGGLSCEVRQLAAVWTDDMQRNVVKSVLSRHEDAVNKLAHSAEHGLLLSTSWDGTMHVHRTDTPDYIRVKLAGKPFAIALTAERAVIAMADRKVSIYDLEALRKLVEQSGSTAESQAILEVQPWQERESSLKFMTRAVACMPDGAGFATSSLEGRVGVEWFDPEMQKETYAFKCHRQSQQTVDEDGDDVDVDVVFPVNALAFHPVYGTFATGGGDGTVALWDPETKRRVRQYHPYGASVEALAFSADGRYLAIGISPAFEDGTEDVDMDNNPVKIIIRELVEGEAKAKGKN